MHQAVDRGAVDVASADAGGTVGVKCASHAHVTHDWKAPAQRAPPNFEVGFPQIRRVRIGEGVLDERLRCIANARFLPDWAIYPLERSAAAFEQAGGRARGEVVAVAVEVRLAQPEAGALAGAARKRQARAATKEDAEMSLSTFVWSHTGDARRNAPASGPACERTRALVASSNDGKTTLSLCRVIIAEEA